MHIPIIAFRHLPPWRKDVVNQCLEFEVHGLREMDPSFCGSFVTTAGFVTGMARFVTTARFVTMARFVTTARLVTQERVTNRGAIVPLSLSLFILF